MQSQRPPKIGAVTLGIMLALLSLILTILVSLTALKYQGIGRVPNLTTILEANKDSLMLVCLIFSFSAAACVTVLFVQRTLLELVHKQSEQQLQVSDRLFRQLANNVDHVFLVSRADELGTVYVNPIFEKVYGLSLDKQIKDKFAFLKVVHRDDRRTVISFLNNVSAPAMSAGIEFRVVHPDKSVHWIFGRLFPMFDRQGKMIELYGISNDITERKEAERTMKDFYSTLSHELRAPLTSIHASLRLMETGLAGPLTDKSSHIVAIARQESDRLIRMLNEILEAHKLEAGMLPFKPKPTKIDTLVKQSVHALRGVAEDNGIKVESKIDCNDPLHCDQDRIVQVLINILSNAIKFSPTGGTVYLTVERVGDEVRFAIRDEGPGIPTDKQHLLFQKFQQLANDRSKAGTGLGLAISKEIVERHHGRIGVESESGSGATFFFELPIEVESGEPHQPERLAILTS